MKKIYYTNFQIQKLQKTISNERSDRERVERQTLDIIRDIKKKWQKETEEQINTLEEEIRVIS